MVLKYYFGFRMDSIFEYHDVAAGYHLPFRYLKMKETIPGGDSVVIYPFFGAVESYPNNVFCFGYGYDFDPYRMSAFISQDTDLWDQLQAEGFNVIPEGRWYFSISRKMTVGWVGPVEDSLRFDVYRRTGDIETLLFSTETPTRSHDTTYWVDVWTSIQPEFFILPEDRLVVKVYCYVDSAINPSYLCTGASAGRRSYVQLSPQGSSNLSSNAQIFIMPDSSQFPVAVEAEGYNDLNTFTFDIKLKHRCDHQLSDGQYKLSNCPRCLGTGYYHDIKFDAIGHPIELSLVDKLAQALEKIILTQRNDFHPEIAINLQKWLGKFRIQEIKAMIKQDILKGIASLKEYQKSAARLTAEAQISSIDSIEISEITPDQLYYIVSITTVAGNRQKLTGSVGFSGTDIV